MSTLRGEGYIRTVTHSYLISTCCDGSHGPENTKTLSFDHIVYTRCHKTCSNARQSVIQAGHVFDLGVLNTHSKNPSLSLSVSSARLWMGLLHMSKRNEMGGTIQL